MRKKSDRDIEFLLEQTVKKRRKRPTVCSKSYRTEGGGASKGEGSRKAFGVCAKYEKSLKKHIVRGLGANSGMKGGRSSGGGQDTLYGGGQQEKKKKAR